MRWLDSTSGRVATFGAGAVLMACLLVWGFQHIGKRLTTLEATLDSLADERQSERLDVEALLRAMEDITLRTAETEEDLTAIASLTQQVHTQVTELVVMSQDAEDRLDQAVTRAQTLADRLESHRLHVDSLGAQTTQLYATVEQVIAALRDSDLPVLASLTDPSIDDVQVVSAASDLVLKAPTLSLGMAPPRATGTSNIPEWIPYPVRVGDNLWNISTYFTGSPLHYGEIAAANALGEGTRIYPGRWLRIPTHLILPEAWDAGPEQPADALR